MMTKPSSIAALQADLKAAHDPAERERIASAMAYLEKLYAPGKKKSIAAGMGPVSSRPVSPSIAIMGTVSSPRLAVQAPAFASAAIDVGLE